MIMDIYKKKYDEALEKARELSKSISLIDKAAVVAEIDRRIKVLQEHPYENHKTICHLDSLKQSLDTLEVKDANEALRTEYEKGRADVITKTLEWINVFNDNNYIMQYSDSCEHQINEIIEWYKNYINRE